MKNTFKIKDKIIGEDNPVFFIAEAGVNHNGSTKIGMELIDIADKAGADAIKFQTFKTENIITKLAPKSSYHIETTGSDKDQTWFELLKTQEMSKDMHIDLINYSKKRGIIFLSTPYDEESVDLLFELGVPAFKIASTDTNNIPFLSYVAKKGLPMIMSSAMSNMDEVKEAVSTVKEEGLKKIVMMQCTGSYPAKLIDSNINVIRQYKKELDCVIGFSDHTQEFINPVAATALGAKVYEKHFTKDKFMDGPDHRMSIDPEELKRTIKLIRDTEFALGSKNKRVLKCEKENRIKLRKSIVANRNILKGQVISKEMIGIKRPGNGIPPKDFKSIIGKKSLNNVQIGTPLTFEMINEK